MRYNRADMDSTLRAAKRAAAKNDTPHYVYATAYGLAINKQRYKWQRNLVVYPSGKVEEVEAEAY